MSHIPEFANVRSDSVTERFRFDDPAKRVLGSYVGGQTISGASIKIETPFDGTAQIALGTIARPTAILGPETCLAGVAGQYQNPESLVIPNPGGTVLLTIARGGASRGAGIVTYELRNA